jgi:hypothetical protein
MANLKLSQLPAAAALTGTEALPVVQGGQTRITTTAAVADLRKGAWQAFALHAPWVPFGDPFATAGYRKDGGRVQLRGLVKAGAGGSVICVLPTAFRPLTQLLFLVGCDLAAPARIDIKSSGDVLVALPTSGVLGWLSLDSIAFYVDA